MERLLDEISFEAPELDETVDHDRSPVCRAHAGRHRQERGPVPVYSVSSERPPESERVVRFFKGGAWRTWSARGALLLILATSIVAACGKKGPPLAPLARQPRPPAEFTARRLGSQVYVRFKVPEANTDNEQPATPPGRRGVCDDRQPAVRSKISSTWVRWSRPSRCGRLHHRHRHLRLRGFRRHHRPRRGLYQPGRRARSGGSSSPRCSTPEMATPVLTRAEVRLAEEAADAEPLPTPVVRRPLLDVISTPPLLRYYVAVGVNRRGRHGPITPRAGVPLSDPPESPAKPAVTYTADAVTVTWTPPATARRAIQEPQTAPLVAPGAIAGPAGARAVPPDPGGGRAAGGTPAARGPRPLRSGGHAS